MKYRVAAFKGDLFNHWASFPYDSKEAAQAYCEDCNAKCSFITNMTYKVLDMEDDEGNIQF